MKKLFILLSFVIAISVQAQDKRYVTTVSGIPFSNQYNAYTSGGTLKTATFSNPMYLALDAKGNLIIVERAYNKPGGNHMDVGLQPRFQENGVFSSYAGIVSLLSEEENAVKILKTGDLFNAPGVSPNGKTVFIPHDVKFDYTRIDTDSDYLISNSAFAIPPSPYNDNYNWKFSFATNPADTAEFPYVYTVMYNRELIKFHSLLSQSSEMLIQDCGFRQSSEVFLAFNPAEDNVLYISVTNNHSIYRMDLKKDSIIAEPYAGYAVVHPEGIRAPYSGAHDGAYVDSILRQARFAFPKQIAFDKEGVMYIADTYNHCIRTIDTQEANPEVRTLAGTSERRKVGSPASKKTALFGIQGFKDGLAKEACFAWPMGVAVSDNGDIYVADTRNYAIRKITKNYTPPASTSKNLVSEFTLYPNPAKETVRVTFNSGFKCNTVELLDLSGKIITSKPFDSVLDFNTSSLKGVYLIKAGEFTEKLIVQ